MADTGFDLAVDARRWYVNLEHRLYWVVDDSLHCMWRLELLSADPVPDAEWGRIRDIIDGEW